VEMLQQAGIAATPSMSSEDLYKDPHLQERQFWIKVTHQELGERHTLGLPWKLSRTPVTIDRASPLMGQHNGYVLGDLLGLTSNEISVLEEEGVCY
ncbi:MAG: CoA transferase, partial [Dehalococcoidia bacterium]|nr:CoA transferase [Dehalococcoidia bacterium]